MAGVGIYLGILGVNSQFGTEGIFNFAKITYFCQSNLTHSVAVFCLPSNYKIFYFYVLMSTHLYFSFLFNFLLLS